MSNEAGQHYAVAHAAHYVSKDLQRALELYKAIMAAHPDTPEASYAQFQLQNIVSGVVPKPALLAAQLALARTYFEVPLPVDAPPASAPAALRSFSDEDSGDD